MSAPTGDRAPSEMEQLAAQKRQRARLDEILGRFVRHDDARLSDRDLALAVLCRYRKHIDEHLGDPSE